MAATAVGRLDPFDENKDKWKNYKLRLECWLEACEVPGDKKKNAMLFAIGEHIVDLLQGLCAPQRISDKSYTEIVTILDNYFTQGTNELAEAYKFDTRHQKEDETVADYILALKKLSINCGFGDTDQVKLRLRNRLVAGVKSESIKNKLLAEGAALTWTRAEELATTMELAHKEATGMVKGEEVNRIQFKSNKPCHRCDSRSHVPPKCTHINSKCYKCNKVGHLAKCCRSPQSFSPRNTRYQGRGQTRGHSRGQGRWFGQQNRRSYRRQNTNEVYEELEKEDEELAAICSMNEKGSSEYKVAVAVNGIDITFAIDTCSNYSIIDEHTYYQYFSDNKLEDASMNLRCFNGIEVKLLGQMNVKVKYNNQEKTLRLVVAKGRRTSLLGREWLREIKLNWTNIFSIDEDLKLNDILKRYDSLFQNAVGEIKGFEAKIEMKAENPKVFKARPVPYSLQKPVGEEIERLEKAGVLKKVDRSDYASPQVVVPKKDGGIRLCGDYKVSINSDMKDQPYPLSTAEDIFATLAGGEKFSTIDLSQAYAQVKVEEKSQRYLTVNTIKGLYQVTRLPYGIKTAPHIFQSIMDQILQGIPGVCCYLDDILITAPNDKEHLQRLNAVFERLKKHNVYVKKKKCSFMLKEVTYLGHVIDKNGRKPHPDKVKAISKAEPPTDVSGLRTFLGMVNYYGSFLQNLSSRLNPLNELLRKDIPWKWTPECQKAFDDVKTALTSPQVLTHYNSKKKLVLACDASPYGVGAVLSHYEDGESPIAFDSRTPTERPIAFASRTLTSAEKNYSQIEKEALAIIFAIQKFHKYLYGRHFSLITDHNPLTYIFAPDKSIPKMTAMRLQRWSLKLSAYDYEIHYRRSQDHANADYLSRAPVEKAVKDIECEVNHFSYVNELPVMSSDIAKYTKQDPVLSKVLRYTLEGWPKTVEQELYPYQNRKEEISIEEGCLLWGLRVIIPVKLQDRMIDEIHAEHPGIVRMKQMARSYLWFPQIDNVIESIANSCPTCMSVRKDPPKSPMFPWKYPENPWDRIHIDYATFQGENYLLVVDAHTKWLEVYNMKSTTSFKTIEVLREMFSRYGLCRELVSDNGPQFTSDEFKDFLRENGIKHTFTPPYHPSSNGLAERAVQTVKNALKKHVVEDGKTSPKRLQQFLLNYRTTPHATTGKSPGEMLFKRSLKTRLSLIKPNHQDKVCEKQEKMKAYVDRPTTKLLTYEPHEHVRVKNAKGGLINYVPGIIIAQKGPVQYLVRVGARVRYVHTDHLLKTTDITQSEFPMLHTENARPLPSSPVPDSPEMRISSPKPPPSPPPEARFHDSRPSPPPVMISSPSPLQQRSKPIRTRPKRTSRIPARFNSEEFVLNG